MTTTPIVVEPRLDEIRAEIAAVLERAGVSRDPLVWLAILIDEIGKAIQDVETTYGDDSRLKMWVVHAGWNARAWLLRKFGKAA